VSGRPARPLAVAAEGALGLLTLAVVLGLGRLFTGGGWLGPIAANAAAAHLVVTAARRRGLSLATTAALVVPSAATVIAWTSYWSTTALGLPTGDTWSAARSDLRGAWSLYKEVVAPTPAAAGFVVASSAAVWLVAYVADWAAFRLWVPFEATLPAGTLFLFTALLGTARGRGWAVALYAGTLIGFLLLHRTARQDGSSHWVAERQRHGHRSILTAGAVLGVVAVVAGTALGPSLPGADRPGVFDPRALSGAPPRTTVSPLVDIRSRLVDQSARELFNVQSTRPAYWRLTSLDRFTGEVWSSSSSYDDAEGELPVAVDTAVATELVEQRYTIRSLAALWLPSAFVPRTFEPIAGAPALFDEGSATLIVDREADTSDGLVYEVTSTAPRITAADLEGVGTDVPSDIADDYLDLPDDFSPRVRALAEELAGPGVASSPYDAALRLQRHLRSFTYDLEIQPGHDGDALEVFLFELRRGYCEQFAGSFAAMARAVGLPARVAVGFTQGEEDPTQPGTYVVRGEHAHAWPEVYLAGAGWVAFEPTPGRGQPFTEDYTGVPPQQAATGDPVGSETLPPTSTTVPIPSDGAAPTVRPPQEDLETIGGGDTPEGGAGTEDPPLVRYVVRPLVVVLLALLALALLHVLAFPLVTALRRQRRRHRATTPGARVALAWDEVIEAARMVGYRHRAALTPTETAEALAGRIAPGEADPPVLPAARQLARQVQESVYSPGGADELAAELADEAAAALQAAIREQAGWAARLRHHLDPRPALRTWRRARTAQQRHITTAVRGGSEEDANRDLQPLG